MLQRHFYGQITNEDLVNTVFEPQEQINGKQAELFGAAFTLVVGGSAEIHVGIGGGSSSSELLWGEQKIEKEAENSKIFIGVTTENIETLLGTFNGWSY